MAAGSFRFEMKKHQDMATQQKVIANATVCPSTAAMNHKNPFKIAPPVTITFVKGVDSAKDV